MTSSPSSTTYLPSAGEGKKSVTDADLLNGPQLKSAAKTQAEIDALMFGS